MTKAPIGLQELRKKIYAKAKTEPSWRFWGLYVHVCKMETLRAAYQLAKANDGSPGIDGITFEAIEASGVERFLEQLRDELSSGTYQPRRNRRREIPKGGGKVRVLGIPTIRDRVVQGALKLILEPIFEADFQPGSHGYRPKRSAHQAIARVAHAIAWGKTRVIDVDLKAFFDNVRHDLLLAKVAKRVDDDRVLRLLKQILKVSGKKGVPQGGVISPLLSNLYLDSVDRMLEKAKAVTFDGYEHVEYARYADDLVVLIDGHPSHDRLQEQVARRLREEMAKLHVELNEEKSRMVDLKADENFGFLGFDFRRVRSRRGRWRPNFAPQMKKRTALLRKLSHIFREHRSQLLEGIVALINPILRGWVSYFAIGHSSRCFSYVEAWVLRKMRRHLMRARQRQGFGWNRWSDSWLYERYGLHRDYRISYPQRKTLQVGLHQVP
jgi:RNA-directed DNA polymerase